jgi:hypothetical protein
MHGVFHTTLVIYEGITDINVFANNIQTFQARSIASGYYNINAIVKTEIYYALHKD